VAVGASGEDIGTLKYAGGVWLLKGSASGLTGTGTQSFTQNTTGVPMSSPDAPTATLPHPQAARPSSPHTSLTHYQVLDVLQDLLRCWTGTCTTCGRPYPPNEAATDSAEPNEALLGLVRSIMFGAR
jgi:hypothetical protein